MPDQAVHNQDLQEREKFDAAAASWWDPEGPFRPLHRLNPTRLRYVSERCSLEDALVLDVGCGGGILSESLAQLGAQVTGIDIAPRALDVAKLHSLESGVAVDYREIAIEQLAEETPGQFDVITCMEMLEHVPDPESVVESIGRLLKPSGHAFLSTLNRTPWSFVLGIIGAEYVARIVPRGTHRYDRFIRPSELSGWVRKAGLSVRDVCGLHYDPLSGVSSTGGGVQVNYLLHARKT